MRRRITLSVIHWLAPALLLAVGFGQAAAQEVPFTGIVTQSQTDVRAGAADRFYRVGELDKGQLVQVHEVLSGWNKIVPPKGVFSYISKAFVDAKGDGSAGVVNTDASKVTAADLNGPAGSYRPQVLLNEGAGVQIVAEEGSHYKIVSPPGAYVYLPPGSVRRALAMEAATAEDPADAPDETPDEADEDEPAPVAQPAEPVVETTPAPEVAPDAPDEPSADIADAPVAPAADDQAVADLVDLLDASKSAEPEPAIQAASLADLERRMALLFVLDVEAQPLDEMIGQYQAIQDDPGLSASDRLIVAKRIAALEKNKQIAQGLTSIADARAATQPDGTAEPDRPQVHYDAVGRLLASSIYDGKTLPRMYRLVDPTTGRAVAYLRPGGNQAGSVSTTRFLGRLVGVTGQRAYDPALKLGVINVQQINALEPATD